MKRLFIAIPTLLAAGFMPAQGWAEDDSRADRHDKKSFLDNLEAIVSDISESHTYTLAQHQSHASHGSHGSHGSHRSGGYAPPNVPEDGRGLSFVSYEEGSGRNEMSTPRSTILPSSPAIAKKVKILPGNSAKFKEIVSRLQIALLSQGYDVGQINGEMDAKTIAAIYHYQSRSGLIPSGRVSDETLGLLGIVAQ